MCDEGETMELSYNGINKSYADRQNYFRMVGTGTFAVTGERIRGFYLNNGTTYFKSNGCVPSSGIYFNGGALKLDSAVTSDPSGTFVFADNTTAILDDGGVTREFASAIGNDTSASFTKKGAGTLTLSQVPQYTGKTRVEGGKLITPNTFVYDLDSDTMVEEVGDTYVFEKKAFRVKNVEFEYFADYAGAKLVTADVELDGTYTLKIGNTTYEAEASNGKVTFAPENGVTGLSVGDNSYTIALKGGDESESYGSTVTAGTKKEGWIVEDADNPASTGTWTKDGVAASLSYDETTKIAALSGDNVYTPTTFGEGVVTLTTQVTFGEEGEQDYVMTGAQAGIKIASDGNGGYNFAYYTAQNDTPAWVTTDKTASASELYTVTIMLNYDTKKYSLSVTGGAYAAATTIVSEAAFANSGSTSLKSITYHGTGTFKSLEGSKISSQVEITEGTGEGAATYAVSSAFISQYLSDKTVTEAAAALAPNADDASAKGANGYNYFANYALGLVPTDEEDKPEVRVTTNAEGKFVVTLTDKEGTVLDVADNVAVTLSVKTGTKPEEVTGEGSSGEITVGDGTGEGQSFVIDPAKVESVKYYKVQINIGAK